MWNGNYFGSIFFIRINILNWIDHFHTYNIHAVFSLIFKTNQLLTFSRLLDLKNTDSAQFFQTTDDSNATNLLLDLNATEKACLDKLETRNVDFGFDKESGHKQLLDAVNDAIEGLDQIKKHSNLDIDKFKEYEKSQRNIEELEKDKFDLETLKSDFESKFPKFNEKLLKEASEKIARMIENDDVDDDDS